MNMKCIQSAQKAKRNETKRCCFKILFTLNLSEGTQTHTHTHTFMNTESLTLRSLSHALTLSLTLYPSLNPLPVPEKNITCESARTHGTGTACKRGLRKLKARKKKPARTNMKRIIQNEKNVAEFHVRTKREARHGKTRRGECTRSAKRAYGMQRATLRTVCRVTRLPRRYLQYCTHTQAVRERERVRYTHMQAGSSSSDNCAYSTL